MLTVLNNQHSKDISLEGVSRSSASLSVRLASSTTRELFNEKTARASSWTVGAGAYLHYRGPAQEHNKTNTYSTGHVTTPARCPHRCVVHSDTRCALVHEHLVRGASYDMVLVTACRILN